MSELLSWQPIRGRLPPRRGPIGSAFTNGERMTLSTKIQPLGSL